MGGYLLGYLGLIESNASIFFNILIGLLRNALRLRNYLDYIVTVLRPSLGLLQITKSHGSNVFGAL